MPIWPGSVSGKTIQWIFINTFTNEHIDDIHVNDLRKALDVLSSYCSVEKSTVLNGHYVTEMNGHYSSNEADAKSGFKSTHKQGYTVIEVPIGFENYSKCSCQTVGSPAGDCSSEYSAVKRALYYTVLKTKRNDINYAANRAYESNDGPSTDRGRCGSNRDGGP